MNSASHDNPLFAEHSLFGAALACLQACDPDDKIALTRQVAEAWRTQQLDQAALQPVLRLEQPGRPALPQLVAARELARRRLTSREGQAALIHAICHIEFNAINLAWDAVYRFQGMPAEFYGDWIQVAEEEAYHFELLRAHLRSLGYDYGDFTAHNGLWQSALDTQHDPLVRMALVPRVLEARGLDVTPGIMQKLLAIGDDKAVAILEIIHRDEVGHVQAGSRWFRYLCAQRGFDAEKMFAELLNEYMKGGIKGPLDHAVRRRAGFSEAELEFLEQAI